MFTIKQKEPFYI